MCVCFLFFLPDGPMDQKTSCPVLRSSISVEFTPVTTAEDIAIQVFCYFWVGGLSKLWFVSWAEDGGGGDAKKLRMVVVWMTVFVGEMIQADDTQHVSTGRLKHLG